MQMKKHNIMIPMVLIIAAVLLMSGCNAQPDETLYGSAPSFIPTSSISSSTGESTPGSSVPATSAPTSTPATGTPPPATNAPAVDTPTHAHEYTETVTAPTCSKDGYTTYKCSCGHTYTGASTNAAGHSYSDWATTKEPTTSATGTAERKCSACGNKETKTLDKLIENHTHNYSGSVTTQPSCTAEGVKTFVCSCGSSYTESIAKTEHSYKATVTAPTCTQAGYTTHKCSCGRSYVDTKVNATGHKYTDSVTKPTCTAEGYTKHTCSVCNSSYTDNKTAATGHSYSLTSDTATCTAAGTKTETCGNCGNKKTSTSSAKGHGETKVETKEATCSKSGYKKTICKTCGQTISNETIPANGQCSYTTMSLPDAAAKAVDAGKMNYAKYALSDYCDYNTKICTGCNEIDIESTYFKYSQREAAQMMLKWVNDLRAEVYGTHAYDLQLDDFCQSAAEKRAVQLTTNYSHGGSMTDGECIVNQLGLYNQFLSWKNSPGHYEIMIRRDNTYFGYGYASSGDNGFNAAQGFGCMTFCY